MSKEIMTEEAFYELIENLEVVDKLTIYGKNAIKYWVLKLQKENKLAKEQLKKQDREIEELEKSVDRLTDEQEEREKYVHGLEEKALDNIVTTDKENMQLKKQIRLMAEAFKQDDVRTVEEIIEYFENLAKENNNEI